MGTRGQDRLTESNGSSKMTSKWRVFETVECEVRIRHVLYGSGTVTRSASGQLADDSAHAPGRHSVCTHRMAALLREMTSWPPSWNYDVKSKIPLRRSMYICLRNSLATFHSDLICNDGALGFLKSITPPTRRRTRTRIKIEWVTLWDQFLVRKLIWATNEIVLCYSFIGIKYCSVPFT